MIADLATSGVLVLALGALAALLGVLSSTLAILLRERDRRAWQTTLALVTAVAFGGFVVSLVAVVGGARDAFIDVARRQVPMSEPALQLGQHLSDQIVTLTWGSMIGTVAGPMAALGSVLPWSLGSRAPRTLVSHLPAAGGVVALLVGATGIACATYARAVTEAFGAIANAETSTRTMVLDAALSEAASELATARIVVVVVATATAVIGAAFALRAARAAQPMRARDLAVSGIVLALGASCFVATRAMSHDAEHPIPASRLGSLPPPALPLGGALPEVERCEDVPNVPMLELAAHETRLDGRIIGSPVDAGRDLETLRRNWSILHLDDSFPGAVAVACDASTPISAVAPWLRAALGAGYTRAIVVGERVLRFETRTLGVITRREGCGRSAVLDPNGPPATVYGTWRDVADAVERDGAALRIAP